MKKIIVLTGLFVSALLVTNVANSQVRFNVSVNIGSQPEWGPSGYDHVDYYYLPDIETYYYVPQKQFIYMSNGNWVYSSRLPRAYRNYDLYSGYKVVVNQPKPYMHHQEFRSKYNNYRGRHGQVVLRDDRNYRRDHDRDRRDRRH
jgi:hypothetical protein